LKKVVSGQLKKVVSGSLNKAGLRKTRYFVFFKQKPLFCSFFKKNTKIFFKSFKFLLSIFQVLQISLLFVLFDLKKSTVTCSSMLLLLLLTSYYIFQRKSRCGFFAGFYCWFSRGLFKKSGCFLGLCTITSTLQQRNLYVLENLYGKKLNVPEGK